MQRLRDSSIRSKLTMIVMVATGVALVLAGAIFMAWDHYTMKKSLVHDLETLSSIIGSNCTAAISFNIAADANDVLMALQEEEHIIAAVIYGNEDLVLAHYVRADQVDDFKLPPIDKSGYKFTDNALSMYRTISLDTDRIGTIYIQSDLERLDERLYQIGIAECFIILFCFLIVFGIVSRLQRVVSGPILKLAGVAKIISDEKDYSVRVDHGSKDELGVLVTGFNEMLSQIQRRDSALLNARDELEDRVQIRTKELQEEVVEHERSREQIAASLKEKEILLKEVHHRVKNNLQIITSLLNLQAGEITDRPTRVMFHDSMNRVKSMALIHERLYQSENLAEVEFADYVDSLTRFLMSSLSGNHGRITITSDVEEIILPVDTVVPCGLIINELVTNSLKHAFPNNRSGEITISCKRSEGGHITLTVCDNGIGIPDDIDYQNLKSLGMRLVYSLTDQLNGTLQCDNEQGTRFTIEFECNRHEKEKGHHAPA